MAGTAPEEEDSEPSPGVPTVIGVINWKAIAAAHYRDRQQNGKQVSDKTMALERTYCDKAVELLTSSKPPATPYKLMDAAITAGGWSDKPAPVSSAWEPSTDFSPIASPMKD